MRSFSRNRLYIDSAALINNYQALSDAISPLELIPVLKANAYGCGGGQIAAILKRAGAQHFAVADLHEGLKLDQNPKKIMILGDIIPSEIPMLVDHDFICPVSSLHNAQLLNDCAQIAKKTVNVFLHFDTGMGRTGILPQDCDSFLTAFQHLRNLKIVGLSSHFPHAYGDEALSLQQVSTIKNIYEKLRHASLLNEQISSDKLMLHIANSDGIQNIPTACETPFTHARSGINLYGFYDSQGKKRIPLQPVLRLCSQVISIRELKAGSSIGYGCTKKLTRPTRIATVAIGYADGIPLALSNKGFLYIKGKACPILGRISMDYTTVDISNVAEILPGEEVVCFENIEGLESWAKLKESITYELICSIGNRVERVYR